jgi:hypothetical protein
MQLKKTQALFVFLALSGMCGLHAQEAITPSGGNATGASGSVSYSIGQVACTASKGTSGSVSEGVQQPFEIFGGTGIPAARQINLVITACPNPVTDYVLLKTGDYPLNNLSYLLFDVNGKLLADVKVENNETWIAMNTYPAAQYILKITDDKNEIKTFQIIKSH